MLRGRDDGAKREDFRAFSPNWGWNRFWLASPIFAT
jgi:hypothetical protein